MAPEGFCTWPHPRCCNTKKGTRLLSQCYACHFLIITPIFHLHHKEFQLLVFHSHCDLQFGLLTFYYFLLFKYSLPSYLVNIYQQITKITPLYVFPITLTTLPSLYSPLYLPRETLIPNIYDSPLPRCFKALPRTHQLNELHPDHSVSLTTIHIGNPSLLIPLYFFHRLFNLILNNLLIY